MAQTGKVLSRFHEGDEVVLVEGTYQGTLGVFIRLRGDVGWADIAERNGAVRSHPVSWLAHAVERGPEFNDRRRRRPGGCNRMSVVPNKQLEAWEEEGGAARGLDPTVTSLSGTDNQVEWGVRIKRQVNDEFDRVAAAFTVIAHRQNGRRRTETEAIIAILEEKRLEVMRNENAGYFIHGWQEIGDQVRQLIFQDSRYQAIKTSWPSR
jgi:hypothetical protein